MRFIRDIIQEDLTAVRETDEDADLAKNSLSGVPDFHHPDSVGEDEPNEQVQMGEDGVHDVISTLPKTYDQQLTDPAMKGEIGQVVFDIQTAGSSADEDGDLEIENYDLSDGLARIDPFDRLIRSSDVRSGTAPSVSPFARSPKTQDANFPATSVEKVNHDVYSDSGSDDLDALDDLEALLQWDKGTQPVSDGDGQPVRARTRLLGFAASEFVEDDPFERARNGANQFPVGWLVIISDQGRGASFVLKDGVSNIGRGDDQTVRLDFGDNSISRSNHASVAYDAEQGSFFVGHGGKTNLVRLNNAPLLSTEQLNSGDCIKVGQTVLRFMAFCGESFSWDTTEGKAVGRA